MTAGKRKSLVLAGKENVLPNKRVRKALAPSWASTSAQMNSSDIAFAMETPVSYLLVYLFKHMLFVITGVPQGSVLRPLSNRINLNHLNL